MEEKRTKVCSKCGRELPIEMFSKKAESKDGYQSWCLPCAIEYQRERRQLKKALQKTAQHAANLAGLDADRITTAEGKTYRKVVAEPVCKELKDYTERELFAELKRRVYKWPDDTIYMKMYVNYDKI